MKLKMERYARTVLIRGGHVTLLFANIANTCPPNTTPPQGVPTHQTTQHGTTRMGEEYTAQDTTRGDTGCTRYVDITRLRKPTNTQMPTKGKREN